VQVLETPVHTTCSDPRLDAGILELIRELTARGMSVRNATETAARQAAADATAKRWRADLVDFVVIRTVHLGAQYAAASAAV
jgi:hypothetical protein